MEIQAQVRSQGGQIEAQVQTGAAGQALSLPAKANGQGAAVNGGELLFLALATCCCNDIYREAAGRDIAVESVTVQVTGTFGGPGEPGRDLRYAVQVAAHASVAAIEDLIRHTDQVAEIHATLRAATPVRLSRVEAVAR
jgi:organic hydroperoxide reductase OsmC/OhrA